MNVNWRIIWNIAVKDWKEVRQNRMAWMPAIIVPIIFVVVLPLGVILLPSVFGSAALTSVNNDFQPLLNNLPPDVAQQIAGLTPEQTLVVLLLGFMFSPFFLILPLMMSSIIGADSIVGEKERKTLEALLYSPATDGELYIAKLLSAILPAVLLAWISFIAYTLIVNLVGMSVMGGVWFPLPHWYPLMLFVSPAVATLGMAGIVLVSSRVSTFMEAQQTSGLLVLPIVLLVVGQATGVIYLSVGLVIALGVVIWIIDAILIWLGIKQFSRSSLMARI